MRVVFTRERVVERGECWCDTAGLRLSDRLRGSEIDEELCTARCHGIGMSCAAVDVVLHQVVISHTTYSSLVRRNRPRTLPLTT